jgi:hypothetical protein
VRSPGRRTLLETCPILGLGLAPELRPSKDEARWEEPLEKWLGKNRQSDEQRNEP